MATTMEMANQKKKKLHILVISFPAQSHINQIFDFSKHLISNHPQLKITFITTISNKIKIPLLPHNDEDDLFTFLSVSDGSEHIQQPETTAEAFSRFKAAVSKNLTNFIQQQKESIFPPKIIIYSSVWPWILDIAHQQNMLAVPFFTQSCSVSSVYYHIKNGSLRYPYDEEELKSISFMPPTLEITDLPSFSMDTDSNHTLAWFVADQFSNIDDADFVLFNTFQNLENEVINWMTSRWPVRTIGPTHLLAHDDQKHEELGSIDIEWLNGKETCSVVYVSLGSLVSIDGKQMEELAHGLLMSKCYFLWVVRTEEVHKLPSKLTDLISADEKGLIVNWCSQTRVLAHRAISCYFTHCGWNSTIEALSYGVPLIAMAHWVDQTTNAKFIEDVWEVGVRVKSDENKMASREEIVECVKQVCSGKKGIELRKNAEKWKGLAEEAVGIGGTSDTNIQNFVSTILETY